VALPVIRVRKACPVEALLYAQHGRSLEGVSPSDIFTHGINPWQILAEGKGFSVRSGLKEAGVQNREPMNKKMI
jgi:hypothetical protein